MKSIFGAYHKLEKDISSAYMLKKVAEAEQEDDEVRILSFDIQ